MKVSIGEFYQEIVGAKTNPIHAAKTLTRWNVPFSNIGKGQKKYLVADISFLQAAREAYAQEQPTKGNGADPLVHAKLDRLSSELHAIMAWLKAREARILTTKEKK